VTPVAVDRERLAKLLGMLGSAHDGEVAAAGRAADTLVRRAGATWPEVLMAQLLEPADPDQDLDVAWAVAYCLSFSDRLNDWEIGFCRSLHSRTWTTTKQRAVLSNILNKLGAAAGGT
jgi:hypothetical protein